MTHAMGLMFCAVFLLAISASQDLRLGVAGTILCYSIAAIMAACLTIWVVTS